MESHTPPDQLTQLRRDQSLPCNELVATRDQHAPNKSIRIYICVCNYIILIMSDSCFLRLTCATPGGHLKHLQVSTKRSVLKWRNQSAAYAVRSFLPLSYTINLLVYCILYYIRDFHTVWQAFLYPIDLPGKLVSKSPPLSAGACRPSESSRSHLEERPLQKASVAACSLIQCVPRGP